MRKETIRKVWLLALLMSGFVAGCGRERAPSPVIPIVIVTTPANGANSVALSTTVSATFNVPMNSATINIADFTLVGPGATPVAGAVVYAGSVATFTPAAPLALSTLYTATITSAAKDLAGNALANTVWTFTTSPFPAVTLTVPSNGRTNVPLNQKLVATFNSPMTASTITAAGTFTLALGGGGAAVAGTVTYDTASNSATFAPTAALTANTPYTATVTTAAQSAQGNPLPAIYVWSFTTGQVANAIAPTVISTDPINLANSVPLNQKIAATFSAPMDPATISAAGTFTLAVTAGGAAVPGAASYAGSTAFFTPTANLTPTTNYTATITTAAKDLTGVAMASPNYTWTFTTGTVANATAPTITVTNPASAAMSVPIDQTISATFSAQMDPTTLTNATFTLAVAGGGASVNGSVTYDPASQIATFTPSANLLGNTTYTATISNQVQDLSGNALGSGGAAPNPWSFMTSNAIGTGQATIDLGTAGSFAIMATASTTSTGPTVINGDVGLHPGSSQGIPPSEVNGTIHVNDAAIIKAQTDLLAAYNDAISRSTNAQTLPGNIGGLTFTPGLYSNSSSLLISGGNFTLDAQGDPNAVFIFQMGSTLTTATNSQVILAGGAKAGNIFWQVGSSATLGITSIFKGNVLAAVSITLNTGAAVEGRMFAGSAGDPTGAVTVDASTVTVPAP